MARFVVKKFHCSCGLIVATLLYSTFATANLGTPTEIEGLTESSMIMDVTINDQGNALIMMTDVPTELGGSTCEVFINHYDALTSTFQNKATLFTGTDTSCNIYSGKLVINASGQAIAAWIAGVDMIYVSYYDGATWETATDVSIPTQGNVTHLDIGIDDSGNATLAWVQHETPGSMDDVINLRRYQVGLGWQSEGDIAPALWDSVDASPAVINEIALVVSVSGDAIMVWNDNSMPISIQLDNSITLGAIEKLSNSINTSAFRSIYAGNRNGDLIMLTDNSAGGSSLFYSPSAGWKGEEAFGQSEPNITTPTIAMNDNGNAIVAFNSYDSATFTFSMKVAFREPGMGWGPTETIYTTVPEIGSIFSRNVAIDNNNNVIIVWHDYTNTWEGKVYALYYSPDKGWSAIEQQGRDNLESASAYMDSTPLGAVIAVWKDNRINNTVSETKTWYSIGDMLEGGTQNSPGGGSTNNGDTSDGGGGSTDFLFYLLGIIFLVRKIIRGAIYNSRSQSLL